MAVDIDPIALENALANARLNGVERAIRFSSVPLTSIRRRFDLITANILSHTLKELAPHLGDIHGQHDQQILFEGVAQLSMLDAFGQTAPLRAKVRDAFTAWKHVTGELADLENADEVFITSTTRELLPVAVIGQRPIANRGHTREALQAAFSKYTDDYVAAHKRQPVK